MKRPYQVISAKRRLGNPGPSAVEAAPLSTGSPARARRPPRSPARPTRARRHSVDHTDDEAAPLQTARPYEVAFPFPAGPRDRFPVDIDDYPPYDPLWHHP